MKKNPLALLLAVFLPFSLCSAALAEADAPKTFSEGEYIVGVDMAAGFYSLLVPPDAEAHMTIVSEDGAFTRAIEPKGGAITNRHPEQAPIRADGRYAVYLPNKATVTLKGGSLFAIPHLQNDQSLWRYEGNGRMLVGWDVADGAASIERLSKDEPSSYSIWTKDAERGLVAVEKIEITDDELVLLFIERGWIVELENAAIQVNG